MNKESLDKLQQEIEVIGADKSRIEFQTALQNELKQKNPKEE